MSGPLFLGPARVDEARRRQHAAGFRPGVMLAVLGMLLLYAWLFSSLPHHLGLPGPGLLFELLPDPVVRLNALRIDPTQGQIRSELRVWLNQGWSLGDEIGLLLGVVAGAFLTVYLLPLPAKRPALVAWFLGGVALLYGHRVALGVLAADWLVYLIFHPPDANRRSLACGALAGLLLLGPLWQPESAAITNLLVPALAAAAGALLYRFGLRLLLARPLAAARLRTLAAWSSLLVVLPGALWDGLGLGTWELPLWLLLFLFQWKRLLMYRQDFLGGHIPAHLPPLRFLATFLSPGALPNWSTGADIAQGHAYVENTFYARDKHTVALEGVRLWGVALVYLVGGPVLRHGLAALAETWGVPVFSGSLFRLSGHFVAGKPVETASVIVTCFLEQVRLLVLWAGVMHFKVGVWRVCGHDMAPNYHHPWAATNLVVLYTRFTFYFREFLVRVFYYPVFFRLRRWPVAWRIAAATFASVGLANLLVAHLPEAMFFNGLEFRIGGDVLRRWPYFLLLAAGITVVELFLMGRRSTRKPWTLDRRLPLDLAAAWATWHFYGVIHIFAHFNERATLGDNWRLFLIAFGLG